MSKNRRKTQDLIARKKAGEKKKGKMAHFGAKARRNLEAFAVPPHTGEGGLKRPPSRNPKKGRASLPTRGRVD
jgi:hypothetical protein